jgi:hypothetical protein
LVVWLISTLFAGVVGVALGVSWDAAVVEPQEQRERLAEMSISRAAYTIASCRSVVAATDPETLGGLNHAIDLLGAAREAYRLGRYEQATTIAEASVEDAMAQGCPAISIDPQ